MVLIFSKKDSPRLRYTLNIFFADLLGMSWELVHSKENALTANIPVINYSDEALPGSFQIIPSGLLFEEDVRDLNPKVFIWSGVPVFFEVRDNAELPFDPFSMVFYMVTRYEEYLEHDRDVHGRFIPSNSLAYQYDFLDIPLANIIADKIGNILNDRFGELSVKFPAYTFTPTVDVDIAYAHQGKGIFRAAAGFAKLILTGKIREVRERILVNSGLTDDPYDNFAFQMLVFKDFGLSPLYFMLIGDYGPYDKNISHKNKNFRGLINSLSRDVEVGIHPSYRSFDEPERLEMEISRLEEITGKKITSSRQHFLRMKFPETYRTLIRLGITDDYSMGYASLNGFRAGISIPFYFFDLIDNREKELKIHPFMFMDTAMQDYMGISPEDYLSFVEPLKKRVNFYGGCLTGVWHNYALSNNIEKQEAFLSIIKNAAHDQVL